MAHLPTVTLYFTYEDSSDASGDTAGGGSKIMSTSVISLGEAHFYINEAERFKLKIAILPGIEPTTVMRLHGNLHANTIQATVERFAREDDVFNHEYLAFVIFVVDRQDSLTTDAMEFLSSIGTKKVGFICRDSHESIAKLLEGPYFAVPEGLLKVWRLYADPYGAFVLSTVPLVGSEDRYTTLNASVPDNWSNLAIAVPSRLYYPHSEAKPLNGLRMGVKDNIDIDGVKTSGMSKSRYELYGPAGRSAPAIKHLMDLGAIVVGKTGMTQFSDVEGQTADYVDFHGPFNPRGDGYRSPAGSNSGAGAASAGYDWLDFTIGTDTGGCIRAPAAANGVFGIRPSLGAASLEGVISVHRDLDTLGIIARNLNKLQLISTYLFKNITPSPKLSRLISPFHLFPVENPAIQTLFDRVRSALQMILGTTLEVIDIRELWQTYSLSFTNESYETYFGSVLYNYLNWSQFYEGTAFQAQYLEKFGRGAYLNPLTQFRVARGVKMSSEYFDSVQAKRKCFEDFIDSILGTDGLMFMPCKFEEPEARDVYIPPPCNRDPTAMGMRLHPSHLASLSGRPEVVFPIGELPVTSVISRQEERYAITASLLGPKGMETRIIQCIKNTLELAGLPQMVETGRFAYKKDMPPNPWQELFDSQLAGWIDGYNWEDGGSVVSPGL